MGVGSQVQADQQGEAKVNVGLTLSDLSALCTHYIPRVARHPGSFRRLGIKRASWWPSHELGHLLTVPRRQIGMPLFGLDETLSMGRPEDVRLAATYELAAMIVSAKLLDRCGRPELAEVEYGDGNGVTVSELGCARSAWRMVRSRNLQRIPGTRRGVETLIRARLSLPASYPRAA